MAGTLTARRNGTTAVAVALTAVVLVVIVWHARPSPSELHLSSANAERTCDTFATRHRGYTTDSGGESVGNAERVDRALHLGARAFLATVPKSQGVAECLLTQTDIPACPDGSGLRATESQVLVAADGIRYVLWCPIIPGV